MNKFSVLWLWVILIVPFISGCSKDKSEPSVVTFDKGGVVKGPGGIYVEFPPQAVARTTEFTITKFTGKGDSTLALNKLCGSAYMISPSVVRLEKPVKISIPQGKCRGVSVVVTVPGSGYWSAFRSTVEGTSRSALVPIIGIIGLAEVKPTIRGDTAIYVGSRLQGKVIGLDGKEVNEVKIALRPEDPSVLSPDTLTALQTGKRIGLSKLEVIIPDLDIHDTVTVRVVPNPSEVVTPVKGNRQRGVAGRFLPEALVVEVQDIRNQPVQSAWVDFFGEDDTGVRRLLGGGPTDAAGRRSFFWSTPKGAGVHTVQAVVSGTSKSTTFTATTESGDAPSPNSRQ